MLGSAVRTLLLIAIVAASGAAAVTQSAPPEWTQWGGPTRDFMVPSTGLANSWPASGPKRLWTRPLGEGHSAILAEGGRLYSLYRPSSPARGRFAQEEAVISLDAATGKTIWEHKYPSPTDGVNYTEGAGPHATPLIVGTRLFAVGSRREFFALDAATGKVLWSHDLIKEYGAPEIDRGMANSPLLFNNTLLLPIGGKGQAVGAFNPATGALLWKAGDVEYSPASPSLITVDGQTQLVMFGGDRIAGLDPANGRTLWSHPHRTDWGLTGEPVNMAYRLLRFIIFFSPSLQLFADSACRPAFLVIDHEKLTPLINDDKVSMSHMRWIGYFRREIQESRAVIIYGVRPGKGSINQIAVKTSDLVSCKGAHAVKSYA